MVCEDPETTRMLSSLLDDDPAHLVRLSTPRDLLGSARLASLDLALYDCGPTPSAAIGLLRELRRIGAARPCVVILCDDPSARWAVEAMKEGAADYLVKPLRAEEITGAVHRAAIESRGRAGSAADRVSDGSGEVPFADADRRDVIGRSAAWQELLERARRVAQHPATVLLRGETGTGKEIIARYIASYGPRAAGPLIAVNCAAIPETLVESELFGHARGAFTGATSARRGFFETAHTGTLFLDEIGSLTMAAQGKLLRVLEDRQVRHVGDDRSVPVDVRVLAATNIDLEAAISRREFREDLYYRLNVVPLTLPPLRDRPEDVPLLAQHFLSQVAKERGRPLRLAPEAAELLLRYPFPGNVRELRHAIERAAVFCKGDELRLSDLESLRIRADVVVCRDEPRRPGSIPLTPASLRDALERADGNRSRAARLLGVCRSTFYRHLRQLPPEDAPR